jgi:hypothetical protein
MMFWLYLLACAPNGSPPGPAAPDTSSDGSTNTTFSDPVMGAQSFAEMELLLSDPDRVAGIALVSGSDLDHDGVHEWATTSQDWYGRDNVVRVLQDVQIVDQRMFEGQEGERADSSWGGVLAAGDVDGDGRGDLALSERWSGDPGGAIVRLVRSLDPRDDVWVLAPDAARLAGMTLPPEESGGGLGVAWSYGMELRVDWLPATAFAADTVEVDDDTLWLQGSFDDGYYLNGLDFVRVEGRDQLLLSAATIHATDGATWLCEREAAILDACTALEVDGQAGGGHAVWDEDGDGAPELIAVVGGETRGDGMVWVVDASGTVVAKVAGSRDKALGLATTFVRDGEGEGWLLMGERDTGLRELAYLYAFRVESLEGELVDVQADHLWHSEMHRPGFQITNHRATPTGAYEVLASQPSAGVRRLVFPSR